MNNVILMGRLVADPEIRYSQGAEPTCIARYRLAVDRKYKKDGEQNADFINCVVFGKGAEFAEKYLHKGTKILAIGRIQTGSYTNNDGQKVYTTDVVVEEQEFAESKASQQDGQQFTPTAPTRPDQQASSDGFMNIPDAIQEELPFKV